MTRGWLKAFCTWLTQEADLICVPGYPVNVPASFPPTAADAAPQEDLSMSLTSVVASLLAKAQAIAALIPMLNSLVQLVEASLPAGTPGATKLQAVQDALAAAYAHEQNATVAFSEIWPALSGIASSLVATFKATGAFTSSASTTSATAAAK